VIIADTPDALSPAWLSDALELDIVGVMLEPVGTGQMCDSVRVHLTYAPQVDGPPTVIAKQPAAAPTSRTTALNLRSYEIEVRFYQQLAPELPVRTPHIYYSDIDVATASFVLLMEDMAPARQGDQLAGCSVGEAEIAIDELVKLHAPRWGDPKLADYDWLHHDPETGRMFTLNVLPLLWGGFRERYEERLGPEVHEAGDALITNLERYLSSNHAPLTVVHGDYRLDNLLFGEAGSGAPIAVVDWQTCTHGAGLNDVAYFIGAGLLLDDRLAHERELVERYHDGLAGAGVTDYDFDRCWIDYRLGAWSGLIMAIAASMLVKQTDRGDDMFMTMAHRHARHAIDLEAPALLGKL
jgi:hypothetical protein